MGNIAEFYEKDRWIGDGDTFLNLHTRFNFAEFYHMNMVKVIHHVTKDIISQIVAKFLTMYANEIEKVLREVKNGINVESIQFEVRQKIIEDTVKRLFISEKGK